MTTEEIRNIVNAGNIGIDELNAIRAEYPYFVVPSIIYLKRHKDDSLKSEVRNRLLQSLALAFPDRTILYDLVGDEAGKFLDFYPRQESAPTPDTDATIDSFLDRYGDNNEKELELLDRLIFNPVAADYTQILEKEQPAPTNDDDLLAQTAKAFDNIVASAQPQPQPQPATEPEPVKEPETTDDSMLSESLAKIFIKQRKYAKALEIIKNISLKFPEKSIYFADQIRFLQKLILNDKINKR